MSCPFELCSHECTFGVCMWNMCLGCPVCSLSPFGLCNSRSIIPRTSGLGISPEFPWRRKAAQCQKQVSRQREQSKKQGNDAWGMVVFNISWERMLYALWRDIIDTISLIITQLWMKMLGFFSFFKTEVLKLLGQLGPAHFCLVFSHCALLPLNSSLLFQPSEKNQVTAEFQQEVLETPTCSQRSQGWESLPLEPLKTSSSSSLSSFLCPCIFKQCL